MILFADDNESFVGYVSSWCEQMGLPNVKTATSLQTAKRLLESVSIQRAIVDLVFEGEVGTGIDLLEEVHRRADRAECVLLTGKFVSRESRARLEKIDATIVNKLSLTRGILHNLLSGAPIAPELLSIQSNELDPGELALRIDSLTDGASHIARGQSEREDEIRGTQAIVRILHISDLHIATRKDAQTHRAQLRVDLKRELEIESIDFLVVSGDISSRADREEFEAGSQLINDIAGDFHIDPGSVVIVPGNHDVNWPASRKAYDFYFDGDLVPTVPAQNVIHAADLGVLVRDELRYRERFRSFDEHFFRQTGWKVPYPDVYEEQALVYASPSKGVAFLALNSSWEVDHYFRTRASINSDALIKGMDQMSSEVFSDCLKIAVWHHPVAGQGAMNGDFLDLLTVNGFRLCMHGHAHEAMEIYHKYDDDRGLFMIGAGTFGISRRELTPGLPFQYNLLTLDQDRGSVTVETRRKEKPYGSWSADARWGKKNDPSPRYLITLR